MAARVWKIELLVETDDEHEVERLSNEIERLARDETIKLNHTCRLPWFLTTSGRDEVEAANWRIGLTR